MHIFTSIDFDKNKRKYRLSGLTRHYPCIHRLEASAWAAPQKTSLHSGSSPETPLVENEAAQDEGRIALSQSAELTELWSVLTLTGL